MAEIVLVCGCYVVAARNGLRRTRRLTEDGMRGESGDGMRGESGDGRLME